MWWTTIPSGIFHDGVKNVVGNGVVIDPVTLKKEVDALEKMGVNIQKQLLISRKAHLILPTHRLLDAASEASKGKPKSDEHKLKISEAQTRRWQKIHHPSS